MPPNATSPRIVVLKSDRLYGELICRWIQEYWPTAEVQAFQVGLDALSAIQTGSVNLFITGVRIDDMDGLEHLEPFIEHVLPILIVTSRKDERSFALLKSIRYDGIYDGIAEGMANLGTAMERVMDHRPYVSPTFVPLLKPPKNVTLTGLTEKEQMVLSVIGDGSDDQQAGARLGLSPHTVNTHRKAIMAKLGLHQKGDLMTYAARKGYVHITPEKVYYPGFQRLFDRLRDAGDSPAFP